MLPNRAGPGSRASHGSQRTTLALCGTYGEGRGERGGVASHPARSVGPVIPPMLFPFAARHESERETLP